MTQTVQELAQLQTKVDNIITPEISVDLISPFLDLPGLVGFWPFSSVQRSTGNVYDVSGQNRTLTYNGNPTFNYSNLVPYADLDGTDYFSRGDETDLDILGTEVIYAAAVRGLTCGAWIYPSNLTGSIMGKFTAAGNQRSWRLYGNGTGADMQISANGIAAVTFTGPTLTLNAWQLVVGRFIPSTSGTVWVNGSSLTTTTVAASIFNSTSPFGVGDRGDQVTLFTGRITSAFLCANALSEAHISKLFESTRGAFRV